MTGEEAKKEIIDMANALQLIPNTPKGKAVSMALKALEQEPTDDATLKDIFCMGCEYKEQEPCDAISRQSAIFLASDLKQDLPDDEHITDMVMAHNEGILEYQTQLSLLPPVTPQPKTGHWIDANNGFFNCSECGAYRSMLPAFRENYCPNCGAKMEEELQWFDIA